MPDFGNNSVFSETDANNNSATDPGFPEGMAPSRVDDAARALQGASKRFYDWQSSKLTGGTSTAYTLTYDVAPAALYDGMTHLVQFNQACGASPTLNVNGLGALPIHKYFGGAWGVLAASDVTTDLVCRVAYNSGAGAYRITSSASFFPLSSQSATTFLTSGVTLNNTALFFNGPNTGSIGAAGQTWLIMANAQMQDGIGAALFEAVIFNGASNVADMLATSSSAGASVTISLSAVVTLAAATTFTLQVKDQTSTGGLLAASGSATANKATSITAIRLS
jgi:hypothetical protein